MGSSDENSLEFFTVFLPDHCSENLRIPDAFLQHLNVEIPEKVILKTHYGTFWPVELVQTEDGLFIQEGWSKFVLENSLQLADFLVFKYNGHHLFDILILGANGCEKEQVGSSVRSGPKRYEGNKMTGEEEAEEEDQQAAKDHGSPLRRKEEDENEIKDRDRRRKSGKVLFRDETGSSAGRVKFVGRGEKYSFTGYHPRNLEKGLESLQLNNPFVTKKRKNRSSELYIPRDIREDCNLKFGDNIKLQDPKGRVSDGKVVHWNDGRVMVKDGWKKLSKSNKVYDDDMIICELLPTSKEIVEVIIIHIHREK